MHTQMDPNITLGEVKLKVSHLESSIRFYQDVVGLKIMKLNEAERIVSFTTDGQNTASCARGNSKCSYSFETLKCRTVPFRDIAAGSHVAIHCAA